MRRESLLLKDPAQGSQAVHSRVDKRRKADKAQKAAKVFGSLLFGTTVQRQVEGGSVGNGSDSSRSVGRD